MKSLQRSVRLCIAGISLGLAANAIAQTSVEYTFYNDPFYLSDYVTDPAAVINKGLKQYEWQVVEQSPGLVQALLDHKGYKLRLNIHYSDSKIWFDEVSAENNNCSKKPCEVEQRHIDRWRMGLRRGIAKAITDEAVKDAYNAVYSNK
ncbi:hypothetical protein V1358_09170 [Pseudoalteromonas sp. YIC-656]|uniref:hypothetical protein n=1 Tax=Pseudoalteromonas pernae TaxID=3118054 RepID=UPI003242D671